MVTRKQKKLRRAALALRAAYGIMHEVSQMDGAEARAANCAKRSTRAALKTALSVLPLEDGVLMLGAEG